MLLKSSLVDSREQDLGTAAFIYSNRFKLCLINQFQNMNKTSFRYQAGRGLFWLIYELESLPLLKKRQNSFEISRINKNWLVSG